MNRELNNNNQGAIVSENTHQRQQPRPFMKMSHKITQVGPNSGRGKKKPKKKSQKKKKKSPKKQPKELAREDDSKAEDGDSEGDGSDGADSSKAPKGSKGPKMPKKEKKKTKKKKKEKKKRKKKKGIYKLRGHRDMETDSQETIISESDEGDKFRLKRGGASSKRDSGKSSDTSLVEGSSFTDENLSFNETTSLDGEAEALDKDAPGVFGFHMRPGSIDASTMTGEDLPSSLDVNSSSSKTALNEPESKTRILLSVSSGNLGNKRRNGNSRSGQNKERLPQQLEELIELQQQMLRMQTESFQLTQEIARGGAATAEAVRLLLEGATKSPGQPPDHGLFDSKLLDGSLMKPHNPKPVYVKVAFLKIIDIETIAQQFDAEMYVEARWQENQFHGLSMDGLAGIEFDQCWNPKLKILNLAGDLEVDKASMVLRYEPDSAAPVLVYMWHIKGIFRERMELQQFPFDVQEMSLVLSSDLPSSQIDLHEDTLHESQVTLGASQGSDTWSFYRHVEFKRDFTVREMEGSSKHPVLVVSAHVRRRLGSYFWNTVLIVFLILALTFCILAVEPMKTDRLGIVMTLFLTAVAFKLVTQTTLPNISYLTYLDIYIVFSMVYLFLQGAECAIMLHLSKVKKPEHVKYYDEIAQSCLIALLVLFHLLFIIYIQITVLSRRRHMNKLDHKYKLTRLQRKRARLERQQAAKEAERALFDADEDQANDSPFQYKLGREQTGSEMHM